MARKCYYYVLVFTGDGPVFVTDIATGKNEAEWDKEKKPMAMGENEAHDIAVGLCVNGYIAVLVKNDWTIDVQPYMYKKGVFEWKFNKTKKEA